jgi:hypothetical protein
MLLSAEAQFSGVTLTDVVAALLAAVPAPDRRAD